MSLEQDATVTALVARKTPRVAVGLAVDLAERLAVLALFALFVHRLLPRFIGLVAIEHVYPQLVWQAADVNAQLVLLIVAEALGVARILMRRRSATLPAHPLDWGLSFGAVSLPLLFTAPAAPGALIPAWLATALMLLGLTLTHIGFLLGFQSLSNALLYGVVLAVEVARILREEAVLGGDPAYGAYTSRVRSRLLPGVF
ncbi:MAG: hypothetical protein P8Y53_00305 [Pseudolabrys sp.]